MGKGGATMPLTGIQSRVLTLLAGHRSSESHLAGATGIHLSPGTIRYSHDLDFFHETEEAVATAYRMDAEVLKKSGLNMEMVLSQPGFIRARIRDGTEELLIDWAKDSIWRFFPTVQLEDIGWILHPVDLAVNKVLALAGRDEVRDFIDTIYLHESVLPLGALVWAAAGKDPGLNPRMLLELLQRKGQISQEEIRRLDLRHPLDPGELRQKWKAALLDATEWIATRPPQEAGCLYTNPDTGLVVAPQPGQPVNVLRGQPHGILPRIRNLPAHSFSESPEMRLAIETFFQKAVRE